MNTFKLFKEKYGDFINTAEKRFNELVHSTIDVTKISLFVNGDEPSSNNRKTFYRDDIRSPMMELYEEGKVFNLNKGSDLPKMVAEKLKEANEEDPRIPIFYQLIEQAVRETLI